MWIVGADDQACQSVPVFPSPEIIRLTVRTGENGASTFSLKLVEKKGLSA
jgi:hypothetical protein